MPVMSVTNLTLVLGDEKYKREIYTELAVVDIPLSYNLILGRSILNNYGVIINMEYLCLKLPAIRGITIARRSEKSTHECYKQSTKVIYQTSLPIDLLEKA